VTGEIPRVTVGEADALRVPRIVDLDVGGKRVDAADRRDGTVVVQALEHDRAVGNRCRRSHRRDTGQRDQSENSDCRVTNPLHGDLLGMNTALVADLARTEPSAANFRIAALLRRERENLFMEVSVPSTEMSPAR